AIAFLLFMLLRAIVTAFAGGTPAHGLQRIFVDAKYSMTDNLPMTHIQAMRGMVGVLPVTQTTWFGGYYQEPRNAFAKLVVDHTQLFDVYPDLNVDAETRARFESSRNAVIASEALAAQFGWKSGDLIPIRADIWPKEDGS